ncbi:hypothetical protein ACK1FJ_003992 [Salmonella enterica]
MTNNKLPEWRKALNKAVENYQSTQAWYEENPDNPSAEQDVDAAAGEIEKLIRQYGVLIVLSLMDEIDELQERRKDSAIEINDDMALAFCRAISDDPVGADEIDDIKTGLRAAFANVTAPPALVVPETLPCPVHLEPGLKFGKGVRTQCMLGGGFRDLSQPVDPQIAEYEKVMLQAGNHTEQHLEMVELSGDASKMVASNSPVTQDDWVMVPKEPTQAMIKAWLSEVANFRGHAAGYKAALAAAPQREVKNG